MAVLWSLRNNWSALVVAEGALAAVMLRAAGVWVIASPPPLKLPTADPAAARAAPRSAWA